MSWSDLELDGPGQVACGSLELKLTIGMNCGYSVSLGAIE